MKTLIKTNFDFTGLKKIYHGKVRDVYHLDNDKILIISTDRLSAFDVVLHNGIPYKGQILNQIAATRLRSTEESAAKWREARRDTNRPYGTRCRPVKIENAIRVYLAGHAARQYAAVKRELCRVIFPDSVKENGKTK